MAKFLLLTICVILAVIFVESAWYSPSIRNSHGKIRITVEIDENGKSLSSPLAEIHEVNECNDDCKGKCNDTCGTDARCRYKCYVEDCKCPKKAKKDFSLFGNHELVGCTTKCREYCNRTCGDDLKCREQCYVKTCQCPPPDYVSDDSEESSAESGGDDDSSNDDAEIYNIRRRFKQQKPQCCPVCMGKCIHRCDKGKTRCMKFCKNKCCHDPSDWN